MAKATTEVALDGPSRGTWRYSSDEFRVMSDVPNCGRDESCEPHQTGCYIVASGVRDGDGPLLAASKALYDELKDAPEPPGEMDEAAFRDYGWECSQWFNTVRARALALAQGEGK